MKYIKVAAFTFALLAIVVSIAGIVSPDTFMTVRRLYFETPGRFYAAGGIRVAMGLVLMLAASSSRSPKILRALGAVLCLQGVLATIFFGLEPARTIMEWEAMRGSALVRAGAAVSLCAAAFAAFALASSPPEQKRKAAHIPLSQ